MKSAILTRRKEHWGAQGTPGWLTIVDPLDMTQGEVGLFSCVSLELPWHDNKPMISCIPLGEYEFYWRTDSPKHPEGVYEAKFVPGHERVQIHAANLAGDEDAGYVKQLDGCIAPGMTTAVFPANVKPAGPKAQAGVTGSVAALKKFVEIMRKENFKLVIRAEA